MNEVTFNQSEIIQHLHEGNGSEQHTARPLLPRLCAALAYKRKENVGKKEKNLW